MSDDWKKLFDQASKGEFQPKFRWHEHEYPESTTPDGKIILGNMISQDTKKRRWSPVAWLFGKRRVDLPDTTLTFNLGQPIASGDVYFDPIQQIYQSPAERVKTASSNLMPWRCRQWKIIPSRWTSMKTKIKWAFEYIFKGYWLRSDKSVISSMRKSGRIK